MTPPCPIRTLPALLLALSLTACLDNSPEQHVTAARAALQAADSRVAIIELKGVLQAQPGNVTARLLLVQAFEMAEQWADSEAELRLALRIGATPEQVLPELARTLVKQGKYQEAVDLVPPKYGMGAQSLAAVQAQHADALIALQKPEAAAQAIALGEAALASLGLAETSAELLVAKARLALFKQQPAAAMALLDAALARDGRCVDALYAQAYIAVLSGKSNAAITSYRQILAVEPHQLRALVALGNEYLKNGDMKAAERIVADADRRNPNSPQVLYLRAILDFSQRKFHEADSAIEKITGLVPDFLPGRLLAAATSYALGHYEEGRRNAESVLASKPDNLAAAKILAACQLKLGNPQEARNTLMPFQEARDAGMLSLLGESCLRVQDDARAMEYFDRAASLSPKNAYIKTLQAAGHLAQGESDWAIADLEKAALSSATPQAADMALILLCLSKQKYDQAIAAIAALEKKQPRDALTYNLRALAYLGKQDFSAARNSLQQALILAPNYFPAVSNLANLDRREGKPEAAKKRYVTLLEHNPGDVQAMLAMAQLAASEHQEKEQLVWLQKAIKTQPNALPPHSALVAYYLGRKENREALAVAQGWANSNSAAAIDLLGETQLHTNDAKGAIATYKRLVIKFQRAPAVYLQLARAQVGDHQLAAAHASLDQALKLGPGEQMTQDALLRLALLENNPATALLIARRLQTQQPKSDMGYDREGDILLFLNRPGPAAKCYEQALARGDAPYTLVKLHRSLVRIGEAKAAEQRVRSWIRDHPADEAVRTYLAGQYLEARRDREAIALYQEVLNNAPNEVIALNNLAALYLRNQDPRALATAEKVLKLAPQNAAVRLTTGLILLQQQQFSRALEELQASVRLAPSSGSARYFHALALAHEGNKTEARRELNVALASGSPFQEQASARALLDRL